MPGYGMLGKVLTHPGKRDEMVQVLLAASNLISAAPGCRLYYVNTSPTEPNTIWVMELWDSKEAHDASLNLPGVPELISRGRTMISGFEQILTAPVGGWIASPAKN